MQQRLEKGPGPGLHLALPWPPSGNKLWRSPNSGPLRGRTLLSAEARQYKSKVQTIVDLLDCEPVSGRVFVSMTACPPDRRRRDLDNLLKIILDSLKGAAFGDDSLVDRLLIERGPVEAGGLVRVSIRPL